MSLSFTMRPISMALISVFALQGCVTTGGEKSSSVSETLKNTFNNDDPCANSKRNIGIALGAIGGAIVGGLVSGDKNKTAGILIGALAGGAVGGLIGNEIDHRQCEISKVQKKYDAEINMTPLATTAPDPTATQTGKAQAATTPAAQQRNIGLSVSVIDKEGKPQFASASADIQPEARAMFSEIAQKYVVQKDDKKLAEAVKNRHILLIGHTDDTGSSQLNADLSERRAIAVAKLFKDAGIPESQIYYQGAGETLPMADNSTLEGRAKNRRVEIVDLNDEAAFQTYLDNRRPNTAFYRPAELAKVAKSEVKPVESQPAAPSVVAEAPIKKSKKTSAVATKKPMTTVAAAPSTAATKSADYLDFGGKPFTVNGAKVNAGAMVPQSEGFSLISSAHASDIGRIDTCNVDRPRNAGLVKSLKDGSAYKTSDYLPGLYGRSWYDMVGGNLVLLNKVAVLRDGAAPANKPEFKVYSNYKSSGKDPAPDVFLVPDVNTYQTSNGLLYRVFTNGDHGVQCMDILMPLENSQVAKDGRLVYGNGAEFVSNFKPKMKN